MIVCICANVNTRAVELAMAEGCDTLEALTMATGACSGCGQCRQMCSEMLATAPVPDLAP